MGKKYEFVQFKIKGSDIPMSTWYFVARTPEDVIEHTKNVFQPEMQKGLDEILEMVVKALKFFKDPNPHRISHSRSIAGHAIEMETRTKYEFSIGAFFNSANDLYSKVVKQRLLDVEKMPLYLTDGVVEFGYMDGNTMYEIRSRVFVDEFKFPEEEPLLKNVRFIQWPNGSHWYAKIGKHDIVDCNGNQKWNTRAEAEKAATDFINRGYQ